MDSSPPNMYTVKFGSYVGNQMTPSSWDSGLEMPKARQNIKENLRHLLPAKYPDFKIQESDTKLMSSANSMEEYKDLNTLDQRLQPQQPCSSPACSLPAVPGVQSPAPFVPPAFHGAPLPGVKCYAPTNAFHGMQSPSYFVPTLQRMPSPSPACSAPTLAHHRMPSPAYSMPKSTAHNRMPSPGGPGCPVPTSAHHRMPSPAYSVPTFNGMTSPACSMPTTPHEIPYPCSSTGGHENPNSSGFVEESQYFSYGTDRAIDQNAGSSTTTTFDQSGIFINSYVPFCLPPPVAAPSHNYDHTFGHQSESHYLGIFDLVTVESDPQDTIHTNPKSVRQPSLPLYDQQQSTLWAQQSYSACNSSLHNAAGDPSICEYCGSHLAKLFKLRTMKSFREKHPKLCKKLDYLSKHLKRPCINPSCSCSKYRLHYLHYIDAVKRFQVPLQKTASHSPPKRKRGSPGHTHQEQLLATCD